MTAIVCDQDTAALGDHTLSVTRAAPENGIMATLLDSPLVMAPVVAVSMSNVMMELRLTKYVSYNGYRHARQC